jgi:CYTH domain-containing protein
MREAIAAVEAARAAAMLSTEAFAQEATVAWDGVTLRIKDVEDRAALVLREALERVSRVEAENSVALASARDDAEGLVQKITLLESKLEEERRARETSEREHRECFNELTHL